MTEAAKSAESVPGSRRLPLRWVKVPQQERSAKTLERILDATEALAAEKELDSVSVADICRAAKCSVGVFYSRFSDKGELIRCLFERKFAEAVATTSEALEPGRWDGVSIAELVDVLLVFAVENHSTPGNLMSAFLLASRHDEVLAGRIREMRARLEAIVYALVQGRAGEGAHPDLKTAVHFGVGVVFDTLQGRAIFPPSAEELEHYPTETVVAELRRILMSYFGVRESA